MEIDRSAVSRALAKAIAYKQCGFNADEWRGDFVDLIKTDREHA